MDLYRRLSRKTNWGRVQLKFEIEKAIELDPKFAAALNNKRNSLA
jgi:hypothetical protein